MELFILCFLIFITFLIFRESNKKHIIKEPFKPDGRIFTFCQNYDYKNVGDYYESMYDLTPKETNKKGLYTTLAKKTIDYDFLTNAPLCTMKNAPIQTNYFPDVSIINYKNNSYKPPLDPFDTYSKANENYSILFHPSIQSALMKYNQEEKNELLSRKNIFIDYNDPLLNTPSTSR